MSARSLTIVEQLFSQAFPVLYTVPIFDIFGPLAHDWQWWFTPSFSYVGQGIIMGWDTVVSMNLVSRSLCLLEISLNNADDCV